MYNQLQNPPFTNIPCVILAGGKSSRMGEDKSLLRFKSSLSIVEYQYSKLSKLFSQVYISSKTNKFDFWISNEQLIFDKSDIFSPMVALKAILDKFQDKKVFIIAVDTPFVDNETIKYIIDNSNSTDITIASAQDKVHNLIGIFSSKLTNNIDEYIKNDIHKINYLIKNSNTKIIDFKNSEQFLNINTKDDYQKALKLY